MGIKNKNGKKIPNDTRIPHYISSTRLPRSIVAPSSIVVRIISRVWANIYYATHALIYIHIHTGRAHDVPGNGVFSAYRPKNGANTVGRSWRQAPNLPRGQWKWPITIVHLTIRTCRRRLYASITVLRCINDDICRLIKLNDLLRCTLGNRLNRKNPKAIRYIIIL